MSTFLWILLFVSGAAIIIYFAEQLVKSVTGFSRGIGLSAFLVSLIFIGFDPENLGTGVVGVVEGMDGIARGSVIGATMVAIGLALGITVLITPLHFKKFPAGIIVIQVVAVVIPGILGYDGLLSRIDGGILLLSYGVIVYLLIVMNKRGIEVKAAGEVSESLQKELPGKWKSFGLMILSIGAIVGGGELLVYSSKNILANTGLSGNWFGMVVVALLISIEELARELPAALKGKPDISIGNVMGSIIAFFLFNAGIIALVHPLTIGTETRSFYYPVSLVTVIIISISLAFRKVNRFTGILLILLYGLFVAGNWLF